MTDYIATFFVTSILDEDPDHVICKAHVAATSEAKAQAAAEKMKKAVHKQYGKDLDFEFVLDDLDVFVAAYRPFADLVAAKQVTKVLRK